MNLSKIGSATFILSLFCLVILWGYLPTLWLMGWPQLVLIGLAFVAAIIWLVFSLEQFRQWLKKRSTRYGIGLVVTALAAVIFMGAVNYTAVIFNKKVDLTQNKIHTLSEQTVNILKNLKEPLTITVWTGSLERMSVNIVMRKFLETYKIAGEGKVKIEVKNPNEETLAARQAGITRDNTIVVTSQSGREARVESFNDTKGEEILTNAIIKAVKAGKKKNLCFLSGHGELGLNDSGPAGLSIAKERLVDGTYDAKEISLLADKTVPAECEGLFIMGPKAAPLPEELKTIQSYFENGGNVFASIGLEASPEWRSIVADYGVKIREDLIIDQRMMPPVFVGTKNFAQDIDFVSNFNTLVALPQASSLVVPTAGEIKGTEVKTFLSSESHTFAKDGNLRTIRSANREPGSRSGPHPVGVILTKKMAVAGTVETDPKAESSPDKPKEENTTKEKINQFILLSSNTFAANSYISQLGNLDLFLNTVNQIMQDEDVMGIRPKEMRQAKLELTDVNVRQVMATVLLVALAFALGGIGAAKRRSRFA